MRDRYNNEYTLNMIYVLKKADVDTGWVSVGVLSAARQAKKASGLSGRQWTKLRKAARRKERARQRGPA